MANSLENRIPLIDQKAVKAAFQMDESMLLQGSLKALLFDALPSQSRPKATACALVWRENLEGHIHFCPWAFAAFQKPGLGK
jgi:hypothetical protein